MTDTRFGLSVDSMGIRTYQREVKMRVVRRGLAVVVLLIPLLASLAHISPVSRAEAQGSNPLFGFGVGDWTSYSSALPNQIASINPKSVVRIGVDWAQLQPDCVTSGNTEFECIGGPAPITDQNFQSLDNQVSSYAAAGVKVLFLVSQAPSWAWSPLDCPVNGCWNSTCNSQVCVNALPPADNSTDLGYWSSFVQTLVTRYQTRFPGELSGVEVWNEENAASGWTTGGTVRQADGAYYRNYGPDPNRYASVLCYAYNGDQASGNPVPVIMGGLQAEPTFGTNTVSILQFVNSVFASGAGGCMNAIGLHIYPSSISADDSQNTSYGSFHNSITTTQQALTSNGAGNLPIWITELGYCTNNTYSPTCGFDPNVTPQTVSQALQAQYLECAYQLAVGIPQIQAVLLFTVDDAPSSPPSQQYPWDQFGVYNYPGSAKTAVGTLTQLFATYSTNNVPAITSWNNNCAGVAIPA